MSTEKSAVGWSAAAKGQCGLPRGTSALSPASNHGTGSVFALEYRTRLLAKKDPGLCADVPLIPVAERGRFEVAQTQKQGAAGREPELAFRASGHLRAAELEGSKPKASNTLPGRPPRAGYPDTANSIPPATTGPATSMAPPRPGTPLTV